MYNQHVSILSIHMTWQKSKRGDHFSNRKRLLIFSLRTRSGPHTYPLLESKTHNTSTPQHPALRRVAMATIQGVAVGRDVTTTVQIRGDVAWAAGVASWENQHPTMRVLTRIFEPFPSWRKRLAPYKACGKPWREQLVSDQKHSLKLGLRVVGHIICICQVTLIQLTR